MDGRGEERPTCCLVVQVVVSEKMSIHTLKVEERGARIVCEIPPLSTSWVSPQEGSGEGRKRGGTSGIMHTSRPRKTVSAP